MPLMPAWPAPDHPSWRKETNYSQELARVLPRAFALLTTNSVIDYNKALELVLPFVPQVVIAPQRLRVCFIVASSLAAFEANSEALVWLDEAIELAIQGERDDAVLDMLLLRASLYRAISHFSQAAGDMSTGLILLDQQYHEGNAPVTDLKLHFTANLAGFEYYLGHYEVAEQLLDDARMLSHDLPAALIEAATIEWIQTHIHRLRRRPEEAIRTSLAAATVFTESGSAISAARAQALAAEAAMDYVSAFRAYADRSAILKLAWPHLSMATNLAREAHDPIGRLMIQLTRIRYGRLRQSNENRIAKIENIIRKARNFGDTALVADAFTSLADELAASGETESARNLYQQVLAMLDGGDFPAVGVRARRALMIPREWE